MKKIQFLLFFVVLLGFQQSFGQVYKFQTSSVTLNFKNVKGKWGNWTEPKDTNILITLDTKKSRIVVYSEAIQLFEIIEYLDEKSTPNDETVSFVCKDNDGEDCNVSIVTRKNQDNRIQLYITYEDQIINYNISVFENDISKNNK